MSDRYVFKVVARGTEHARSERFKRIAKGLNVPGLESPISSYKRNLRVRTKLIKATWGHVIILACTYAIGINIVKTAWFMTFGKIDYHIADPASTLPEDQDLIEEVHQPE